MSLNIKSFLVFTAILSFFALKAAEQQDLMPLIDQKINRCIYIKNSIVQLYQASTKKANQQMIHWSIEFNALSNELLSVGKFVGSDKLDLIQKASNEICQILNGQLLDISFANISLGKQSQ
ncbi:MAG: hypothetical protein P4L22_00655 [Candidatus Babeliales bacterium]|nr:hypothetical protein [Candidatus Babeliales bacterium]